jgi:uncharacterized delta-60 repeat protein
MRLESGVFRVPAIGAAVTAVLLLTGVAQASPGGLDPSFGGNGRVVTDLAPNQGGSNVAYAVASYPNDKLVVAGTVSPSGSDSTFGLVRYLFDGSLDRTFGGGDGRVRTAFAEGSAGALNLAVQADGKIVAVGGISGAALAVARYNSDGSLDETFDDDGRVTTNVPGRSPTNGAAVAVQDDGKIVVAGTSEDDFLVVRYESDGSPDETFGTDGVALVDLGGSEHSEAIALQPDGSIVVAGRTVQPPEGDFVWALIRLTSAGLPDPTFGTAGAVMSNLNSRGTEWADDVALQENGKIVAVGKARAKWAIVRYTAGGALDPGFAEGGIARIRFGYYGAEGVVIQSTGKIVVAGPELVGSGAERDLGFGLARFRTDGRFDTTFGGDGHVETPIGRFGDAYAHGLAAQRQRLVVVGRATRDGELRFAAARFGGG